MLEPTKINQGGMRHAYLEEPQVISSFDEQLVGYRLGHLLLFGLYHF